MENVFNRAQVKKISHKKKQNPSGICQKKIQNSQHLLSQFQDVIQHLDDHNKDVDTCKEALRKLYENHKSCYATENITSPNE